MQSRLLVDRYELITPLGRGTMGTVWRAHDRSLGRVVAVKEIRQDPGLSEEQRYELRERMIREGRSAARVSHPSVATVYDAIVVDGRPWIIMELVEGRSLEQVIDEEGPLPPRLVAEIGTDLLGALRAAHQQGILHRDVKPSNVLVTETGRVVLTDFGIAKAEGDSALTKTGMVIGSPGYTAPERARGEHTGPESDLWSLGATLYFAVEGRPAYERSSVRETLAALMTEEADAPTQAGPLRPVLDGLLQKDHTVRLSAEKTAAMLRTVADTPMGSPPPTVDELTPAVLPHKATPGVRRTDATPAVPQASATPVVPQADDDTEKTMMVIRPVGGLRLPPPPPGAPAIASVGPDPRTRTESGMGTGTRPGANPMGGTDISPQARPGTGSNPNTHTGPGTGPNRSAHAETGTGPNSTKHAETGSGPTFGAPAGPGTGPNHDRYAETGPNPGEYEGAGAGPNLGAHAETGRGPAPGPHMESGAGGDVSDDTTIGARLPGMRVFPPDERPTNPPAAAAIPTNLPSLPTQAPPSTPIPGPGPARPAAGAMPAGGPGTGTGRFGMPGHGGAAAGPMTGGGLGTDQFGMPAPVSATGIPGSAGPGTGIAGPGAAGPGAVPGTAGPGAAGPGAVPGTAGPGGVRPGGAGAAGDRLSGSGLGTDLFGMQAPVKTDTSSRIRVIVLIAIAFVAFLALVVLAMAAFGGASTKTSAAGSTTTATANGVRLSASPSGPPSAGAPSAGVPSAGAPSPGVPASPATGLRRHTDAKGFTIDLPEPLKASGKAGATTFRLAGDPRYVRVDLAAHSSKDVVQAVTNAEAKATYAGYRRIRIERVQPAPYPGTDVADWEFTYTSAGGTLAHALSRWVSVPGGASYAIYWVVPQAQWNTYAPQRDAVLASFLPTRAKLPGGS